MSSASIRSAIRRAAAVKRAARRRAMRQRAAAAIQHAVHAGFETITGDWISFSEAQAAVRNGSALLIGDLLVASFTLKGKSC